MTDAFSEYVTQLGFCCANCGRRPGDANGPCDRSSCVARAPRRVYVSGPMSGLPDNNFPAFNARAAELRAAGDDVVNPAELPVPPGTVWSDCLRLDIAHLVTCDAIAMLDGWTASRGAQLEHHIAMALGMTVIYP